MKVKTNLTRRDLVLLNLIMFPRVKNTYGTLAVLFIGLLVWFVLTESPQSPHGWTIAIVASAGGAVGGVLVGLIFSLTTLLVLRVDEGVLGEHEYELLPEGLLERTSVNEGINKWQGVTSVTRAGKYLVFEISGCQFHPIPMRSFASTHAFDEFASEAIRLWKSN